MTQIRTAPVCAISHLRAVTQEVAVLGKDFSVEMYPQTVNNKNNNCRIIFNFPIILLLAYPLSKSCDYQ